MLCTKCSIPIRPVVAIDIDGTLGDYHGHFLDFSASYLYRVLDGEDYNGRGSFREWWCAAFKSDEATWKDCKLAYRQGGQKRTMPIFDGADALCNMVRNEGAELWLTTTRPYQRLDNIDPDTREWLRRNNINYDGLVYGDDKYQQLADNVHGERVAAVVDDERDQYSIAESIFGWRVPCMRWTNWNRGFAIHQPQTLKNVAYEIRVRLDTWRERWEGS